MANPCPSVQSVGDINTHPHGKFVREIRVQEKSVFSVSIRVQELFVRTTVLDGCIVVYESKDIACGGSIDNNKKTK